MSQDKETKKESKKEKTIKITEDNFKKVEELLKAELESRKNSQFRKNHEEIWSKVDDQVALKCPATTGSNPEEEWLASFELGTLSSASEVMTADLLRVIFPDQRQWFEAHVEQPVQFNQVTGEQVPLNKKVQDIMNGRLRAMMTQQHLDFNLRDRVELSIKEALHHGSFVAEVSEDMMSMYLEGDRVKDITSPVWIPHSMWNCYPDPSPALVGSNMFYNGSMFIRSYMPREVFIESATGEGWIQDALKKIPKEEHKVKENVTNKLEIITYWGDVVVPSGEEGEEEDLLFPNHKAIFANGKLVYLDLISTPYPPLIYKGYERMDVRDPYAISPIIKQSPMQSISTSLSNTFLNTVELQARPPIIYDGSDPDFVENGGPNLSPGAKTSSKGSAKFQQLEIGDASIALRGVQWCVENMKNALGRPGVEVGDRATAAEVHTKQADSEAGPFGFAIKVDSALRTFLYMQHALNLSKKDFVYSYYNAEIDSPDFLRITRKEMPESVHFDVVGTKGVLGENQRQAAFMKTTGFLLSNPKTSDLLEIPEIAKQMYMDAGVKSPERFFKSQNPDVIPAEVKQQLQKSSQMIQELQQKLKVAEDENLLRSRKMELDYQAKVAKIENIHQIAISDLQLRAAKLRSDQEIAMGSQAQALKMSDLDKKIKDLEHNIDLTIAKHSSKLVATDDNNVITHPMVNEDGYILHRDAEGNHAYIGPNGEIVEVPDAF